MYRSLLFCCALVITSSSIAFAATFTPLGYLPGGSFHSVAYDVNRDGTVVVGRSNTPQGAEAFRWTRATGMVGLGDLPGGDFYSEASGVSDDGNVVVGPGTLGVSVLKDGFIWNTEDGMQAVGYLNPNPDFNYSYVNGVSGNGNIVVGNSSGRGFLWDAEHGIKELRSSDGSEFMSGAANISGDGRTVVGYRVVGERVIQLNGEEYRFPIRGPAKWSERDGIEELGALDSEDLWGRANAVSHDGQYIVGSSGLSYWQAFRWSDHEGMRSISDITIAEQSSALGVSDAGDVVVGFYRPPSEFGWEFPHNLNGYAFLWTESKGFRPLHAALKSDYNLPLDGWVLGSANAVSGDGKTIVGVGVNPNGARQAWVLSLTVPEPQTAALSLFMMSYLLISRYHHRTRTHYSCRSELIHVSSS